jgi:ADP-ribose pyrophosphatase YjhB (NUDIX family)
MPVMVGGVIEKNGKFLLVQEAKENCRGKWNLPAGHLEINETLFDGARREIFEETGCKVDLTGLLQISHRVFEDKIFVGFMFVAKLIDEHIDFNKNEILNVKWFSYEELISMNEDLRLYYWIIDAIQAYKDNKIMNLNIIKMDNDVINKNITELH